MIFVLKQTVINYEINGKHQDKTEASNRYKQTTFTLVDFNVKLFLKTSHSLAWKGEVWKHSYCTQLPEQQEEWSFEVIF